MKGDLLPHLLCPESPLIPVCSNVSVCMCVCVSLYGVCVCMLCVCACVCACMCVHAYGCVGVHLCGWRVSVGTCMHVWIWGPLSVSVGWIDYVCPHACAPCTHPHMGVHAYAHVWVGVSRVQCPDRGPSTGEGRKEPLKV